ncbi:MAG: efflux RND transporter permease subunit [Candidatus Paceibacterota bacterium]
MYTVWSFFTHKRNFSFLVLGALIVAGLFSVFSIQKESNPEVKIPMGIVTTTLPGASAADMETLVTNEIETVLAGSLSNVNQITSVSQQGVSTVTVEFNASADLDKSIQDLKDRVDTVVSELPEDASDPRVFEVDFSQQPVLTFAVAGDLPPSEFATLGRQLEDNLESIPGVSSVSVSGAPEREVQVIVRQEALQSFGLSLADVVSAIRRSNVNIPVGAIEMNGVSYNLQFEADIADTSEVGNIIVASENGRLIYVRDVALVADGLSEMTSLSRVSVDGEPSMPSLSFDVQKRTGGNVTEITRAVNERLEELQQQDGLLEGLTVVTIFDTGDYLLQDLITLSTSGILAVVLVMIVLFLTIGWRESLVAGLSIPISFMIAFLGLLMSGNTLNFISLFALILSVGILVDSAIVIVEGIHTNMRAWMKAEKDAAVVPTNPLMRTVAIRSSDFGEVDKKSAALKTIRDFHTPVTAGTMTTVAVFVPLFFISGIVGEFIKSIPFTIIFVLLASLVVALGFVPLIASLVLKRRMTSRLEERQEEYTNRALAWYKGILSRFLHDRTLSNRFLALVIGLFFATPILPIKGMFAAAIFCAIVSGTLYLLLERNIRWLILMPALIASIVLASVLTTFLPSFATMKVEFFPVGDEDFLIVEMELPEGTVLDASELEARKVEEILYTEPTIESFVMTVGGSSAYSGTGASAGSKLANAFVQLYGDRNETSAEVADRLSESLSSIQTSEIRVTQLAGGPPVGTPVLITFRGEDLEQLEMLAVEAARILETIEGTNAITTSTKDDSLEFLLTVNKAKAAVLGVDPAAIADTVRTAVYGSTATTINVEEDIDVVVQMALNRDYLDPHDTNQTTIDAVKQLTIQTPNGPVLLGSVVDVELARGSAAIRHDDEKRIATAESQLADGGNVALIVAEFERRAAEELTVPEGVEMVIGGQNEETDQSFAEMGYAIIAGLVLMFSIIVLMFNSFRHAIYVIAPAFLSFIGIALGLTLTGNALSFPALMGLIALVGIVVNNSIILIDVMNSLRREHPEWDKAQFVLEGASSRLRPILLTTTTTVIGIVPLLFTASFWAPLALSIIFGLSFAVIITLVMIPIIYFRNPGSID